MTRAEERACIKARCIVCSVGGRSGLGEGELGVTSMAGLLFDCVHFASSFMWLGL